MSFILTWYWLKELCGVAKEGDGARIVLRVPLCFLRIGWKQEPG